MYSYVKLFHGLYYRVQRPVQVCSTNNIRIDMQNVCVPELLYVKKTCTHCQWYCGKSIYNYVLAYQQYLIVATGAHSNQTILTSRPSLVPRPFRRRKKGLVHIAHACAGVSIATGRVTMVIVRGFCMACSSMDNKQMSIRQCLIPDFFWGSQRMCL